MKSGSCQIGSTEDGNLILTSKENGTEVLSFLLTIVVT